jgi:hypothetical protein
MYLHLARASQQRQRPLVRDKMLVLAGAVAAERGLAQVAACCRQRVLSHNAAHLIGHYPAFSDALEDERFQTLLRKLRRDFPLEKVEHMLSSLGIQIAGERQTYYTDHEYAASLLGLSSEELDRQFGEGRGADTALVTSAGAADPRLPSPVVCRPSGNLPTIAPWIMAALVALAAALVIISLLR